MSAPRRVKRKPPPTFQFSARYPSPDPEDPFAPLWVLRSRSSNHTIQAKHSYDAYPPVVHARSQSTPPEQVYAFPSIQPPLDPDTPPVPSLLTDNTDDTSDNGVDAESNIPLPTPTPEEHAQLLEFDIEPIKKDSITPPTVPTSPPLKPPSRSPSRSPSSSHDEYYSQPESDPPQLSRPHSKKSISRPSESSPPVSNSSSGSSSSSISSKKPISRAPTPITDSAPSNAENVPPLPAKSPSPAPRAGTPTSSINSSALSRRAQSQTHAPHRLPRPTEPFFSLIPHPPTPIPPEPPRVQSRPPSSHSHTHPHSHPLQGEWTLPTPTQIVTASTLSVIAESGVRIPFGSLFAERRTIIIFIRHVWCHMCQDYMSSLKSIAKPEMMFMSSGDEQGAGLSVTDPEDKADTSAKGKGKEGQQKRNHVQLIIISNASHLYLPKYRQIFNMPFSMYTDPSLAVYDALGMGRDGAKNPVETAPISKPRSLSVGANEKNRREKGQAVEKKKKEEKGQASQNKTERRKVLDGGYARHGIVGGFAMVIMRALKTGMPIWEKGGDFAQLGGEFVFGPGPICTYAHRMQSPKGHAPVQDVLRAAGIRVSPPSAPNTPATPAPPASRRTSLKRTRTAGSLRRRGNMSGPGGAKANRLRPSSAKTEERGGDRSSFGHMTREEEAEWMEERAKSLEKLREKKSFRRGFTGCSHGAKSAIVGTSEVVVKDVDEGKVTERRANKHGDSQGRFAPVIEEPEKEAIVVTEPKGDQDVDKHCIKETEGEKVEEKEAVGVQLNEERILDPPKEKEDQSHNTEEKH